MPYDPEDLKRLAGLHWKYHDEDSNYCVLPDGSSHPCAAITDQSFKGAAELGTHLERLGFIQSDSEEHNSFYGYDNMGFVIVGKQNVGHLKELLKTQGIELHPEPNELSPQQARKMRGGFVDRQSQVTAPPALGFTDKIRAGLSFLRNRF